MAFGIWGLLVGQVGLALSVVSGMTMGIVVDDTVHFLSKYSARPAGTGAWTDGRCRALCILHGGHRAVGDLTGAHDRLWHTGIVTLSN